MRRVRLLVLAILAAAMLALSAGAASAEGHHCRHWYPDPYYGGYWLWVECPGEPGGWGNWYPDLYPASESSSPYLDIREPIYY
jgi:hypothetical protein